MSTEAADHPTTVTAARTAAPADARVMDVVKRHWGFDQLRPLQAEAIQAALAGRDSLLVMPTGGGKSLCYQVPPLVAGGLTLVVSPLIALMQDQVAAMRLAGIPAAALHGQLERDEAADIRKQLTERRLRLLLVAPERLFGSSMLAALVHAGVARIAIDEAHCISQWGHDFRPEYRRLAELREVFPHAAFNACTATATPRVREDIVAQLRLRDPVLLTGSFDRPNLTYRVLPRVSPAAQCIEVLSRLKAPGSTSLSGAAIVYCFSRNDTESLAEQLRARHVDARAYHAGLDHRTRRAVLEDFKAERLDVVVATVAFGMGIDRSNVRCVIHAALPSSIEAYQQETGRAGRDGLPAECVMLYSPADVQRRRQLLRLSADESGSAPDVFAAQAELLQRVGDFAASFTCRHAGLLRYFGQTPSTEACGACDVCLGEVREVPEADVVVKKVLSCVARFAVASDPGIQRGLFGGSHLVGVLTGSRAADIVRRGHDRLSTFGLLRTHDKADVSSYVAQLVDAGCLRRTGDEYPVIELTEAGAALLRGSGGTPVTLRRSVHVQREQARKSAEAAAHTTPLSPAEGRLFDALRSLRRRLAEKLGVPPYVVFSDDTLRELARHRPSSSQAMLDIRGVGKVKLAQFGSEFLAAIAQQATQLGLALDAEPR